MRKHYGMPIFRQRIGRTSLEEENALLRKKIQELEKALQESEMTKEKIHEAIRQHVIHTPIYGESK